MLRASDPRGSVMEVSATPYETLWNIEKEFTIGRRSHSKLHYKHTRSLYCRQINVYKNPSRYTLTLNRLLNKTRTVMNIVLHLNMKTPLWQDLLSWVWSTTICVFFFGSFALCISAWCVCDSLFLFHSCHVLINKTLKTLRTEGVSSQQICDRLNHDGVKTDGR